MANGLDMLDKLQEAVIDDGSKKESKPQYHFDKLKMYFGEDFNYKGIIISMPTIGDILEVGEENFYQALSPFIYNSTSIRVMLWDNGVDWNNVKDIEVFNILTTIMNQKNNSVLENIENKKKTLFSMFKKDDKSEEKELTPLSIVFKNIDITKFKLVSVKENESDEPKFALYDKELEMLLDEDDFMMIAEYIREMLNMHPKTERAKGKTAKSWIIQEDKMNAQVKESNNTSTLLPLISTCVNHPGFKYKLQELKEVGIYQFMDSVKRIQKYENGTAALKGVYSGFVSSKDIPDEIINYMGEI